VRHDVRGATRVRDHFFGQAAQSIEIRIRVFQSKQRGFAIGGDSSQRLVDLMGDRSG
jgi:hypothetical protein